MGPVIVQGDVLILLAALLLPVLFWLDRRARRPGSEIAVRIAFVAWIVALAAVVIFPLPLPPYVVDGWLWDSRGWPYPWVGPVPFETIRSSLHQGWNYPAGKYLLGNIAAFVPLGLLAPMLSPRWRSAARALLLGLLASGLVEAMQLLLSLSMGFAWRVADVDDLILNTLGTVIGFGGWVLASAVATRRPTRSAT